MRENVDLYFSHEVAIHNIKPETARHVLSALQKYTGEPQHFVVESNVVRQALECQKRLFLQRLSNKVIDPHRSNLPTNILSEDDHRKVIKKLLLENQPYWKDLLLSWTGCEQMMTCNASMRSF